MPADNKNTRRSGRGVQRKVVVSAVSLSVIYCSKLHEREKKMHDSYSVCCLGISSMRNMVISLVVQARDLALKKKKDPQSPSVPLRFGVILLLTTDQLNLLTATKILDKKSLINY